MTKQSGIMLHISSLPGKYGIGDFGQAAYDFIDFLVETKQSYWQVLPTTTTTVGNSPYQSFSAFAGNTNFIDLDELMKEGYLKRSDFDGVDFGVDNGTVDFNKVNVAHRDLLRLAVSNFEETTDYKTFIKENSEWLIPFAQFMTIKVTLDMRVIYRWPDELRAYDSEKAAAYCRKYEEVYTYYLVTQYWFAKQWKALKKYANDHHIQIIGDIAIYVAEDSAEVWQRPQMFQLDANRTPTFVAGAPPDAYASEGQNWGNPVYNWDYMAENDYDWWVSRIAHNFKLYDYVRIDHFRGFESYWAIPIGASSPREGSWKKGPGMSLFNQIKTELGDLNIIVEDLGSITEEVVALREEAGFPGMNVMQFGFDDEDSIHLPHNYVEHSVSYVSTHDNSTAIDWFENECDLAKKDRILGYVGVRSNESIGDALNRTLAASKSNMVIYSMQDLLHLGPEGKMNNFSIYNNWRWQMLAGALTDEVKERLSELTHKENRINEKI